MSHRCTIVRNDVLDRLLAIERQAQDIVDYWFNPSYEPMAFEDRFDELARLLGPRKE